ITQRPDDVPEDVLTQLGNRVQHALRAYTARDQRALRAAAESYRPNPRFDTATAIRELGVGEALTSFLQKKGVPSVVERTLIRPPASQLGPITEAERAEVIRASPLYGRYDKAVDRDSAYEILARRAEEAAREAAEAEAREEEADDPLTGFWGASRRYSGSRVSRSSSRSRRSDTVAEAFVKSLARSVATRAGSAIVRGILGSLFRGR
ncbi:MAG: DUF853 family protein, partial [Alphaproteobacteria bacterium]